MGFHMPHKDDTHMKKVDDDHVLWCEMRLAETSAQHEGHHVSQQQSPPQLDPPPRWF